MADQLTGINAYNRVANMPKAVESTSSDDFIRMVQTSLSSSADKVQRAEQVGIQAMTGEASIEQLTIAISEAEGALRTVTAVRDRVINAYQDIIKMPI